MKDREIISVSQYLDKLNNTLKGERAKIVGEVSGVQMYEGRSYLYFSIKDSKDSSTVKCFMWKRDFALSGVTLRDGVEVIITAYPNIYKPNGGLTMQVEVIELVGEGALQIAYEKLKKKLELEGLFAESKKREIPEYPHRIGVITSRSGAVINDFLTNIGKFGFEIIFVDSKVEGQDAIKDLLGAVNTLKNKDLDVLVIMRGGGSLESFQAFNNELLVRAVADFPVPVLTGIGHDKDAPLVSMVSDKNVSTPTAVANLLNSTWNDALSLVTLGEERIFSKFSSLLRDKMFFIENSVVRMESGLKNVSNSVEKMGENILRGFSDLLENTLDFLTQSQKTLELLNPERQLAQGYSIVRYKGKVLKSKKDVKGGEELDIIVSDGIIKTITK
ncbi:MAG: exodeoxyribonuclease VII large subunit [Nitrospira sp.]